MLHGHRGRCYHFISSFLFPCSPSVLHSHQGRCYFILSFLSPHSPSVLHGHQGRSYQPFLSHQKKVRVAEMTLAWLPEGCRKTSEPAKTPNQEPIRQAIIILPSVTKTSLNLYNFLDQQQSKKLEQSHLRHIATPFQRVK